MNTERDKESIFELNREELNAACTSLDAPRYRADQLWRWLYVQRAIEWEEMTNLPLAFRDRIAGHLDIKSARVARVDGEKGRTRKLLLQLPDGALVETVLIVAQTRRTVCVSAQVGCKFGCTFCASGQGGFHSNLTHGQIVSQVILAGREFEESPTHVVFMGIGEPFDNYQAVLQSIRTMNDNTGMNIGARRITISTVGVVPGIEQLSKEDLQVELSVSLHAATDEVRSKLMPINRRYPVSDLLAACSAYTRKTNRIITFEYSLMRNINDSEEQAHELVRILLPLKCRVNLIRLNPIDEFEAEACPDSTADMFIAILQKAGINTTYRNSRGRGINAACGQLRAQEMQDS